MLSWPGPVIVVAGMNELQRLAYLQAMGTDAYVSLRQLPGAAATRRIAIMRTPPPPPARPVAGRGGDTAKKGGTKSSPARTIPRPGPAAPATAPAAVAVSSASGMPSRFSLATVSCGGWLWLEELEAAPFTAQQLQLVQGMAFALGLVASGESETRPEVTQFDWPMHSNPQLDQGQESARAGAAGFIRRKLEQLGGRGLILLGSNVEARVALDQLDCASVARTASTAAMLRDPLLKRQAWRDLRSVLQQG